VRVKPTDPQQEKPRYAGLPSRLAIDVDARDCHHGSFTGDSKIS